jgi:hypothetical protein
MSTSLFQRSAILLLSSGVAACGSTTSAGSPTPTGPAIVVDAPACEAGMTTLFTTQGGSFSGGISAIAVGAGGFVYFSTYGNGLFAVPPGGGSAQAITSGSLMGVGANQLWVDGSTLLAQVDSQFYSLPTSGGSPQLLTQLPTAPGDLYGPLPGDAVMDSTDFYVFASNEEDGPSDGTTSLWRVPRTGGAPQILFTSSQYAFNSPMTLDDTNLYFEGGQSGQVYVLPKSGGTPSPVQGALAAFGPLAPEQGQLFLAPEGELERYPLDGSQPDTPIGGVPGIAGVSGAGSLDGAMGYATSLVSDDQGAYVALSSGSVVASNGDCTPPGCSVRMAVAPLPLQNEQVTAHACSPAWTLGLSGNEVTGSYSVAQMALDSSYVYLLADVGLTLPPEPPPAQVILRAAR